MNPHHALDLELAMIRDLITRLDVFATIMTEHNARQLRVIALDLMELSNRVAAGDDVA